MLLTIKQPAYHGHNSFHDYTPPTPPSTSRFSPAVATTGPSLPPIHATNNSLASISALRTTVQQMSTPHRGLPPPAAMGLPQPPQQAPPIGQPPLSQPMGQLPAPPQQWQGAEESMRNWLHAKAEEDKRKQEEEKTRQEALRLEQRKIEQDMLHTSLNGGIPPYMIPMVFAGMGGGNLPNASLEWAQHYMAQTHHLQQQQQLQQQPQLPSQSHTSPEQLQTRDSRATQPYGGPPPQAPMTLPSTPAGPQSSQGGGFYPSSPATRSRSNTQTQGTIVRPPTTSHLPRLNTGEMSIQQVPPGPPGPPGMQILPGQPGHPLSQAQSAQEQESQSSPSIYFHHWQPPNSQAGTSSANRPTTPSDHTSSPKKRKATGPQQPAPPPTSQPHYTSPPFSQGGTSVPTTPSSRRRGHSRQRSEFSARGVESYRPSSRHRLRENSFSTQGIASPPILEQGSVFSTEPRRMGGANPVSSLLEESDSRPQSRQQYQQQSHSQSQEMQHDREYSAGPEMKHEERHRAPKEE